MVRAALRAIALFCVSLVSLVCACGEPPGDSVASQTAAAMPQSVEGLLFGSSEGCNEDPDCPSGACIYGMCAGLLSVDQRWQVESIARRLASRLASDPALGAMLEDALKRLITQPDLGLNSRGRAAQGLAELRLPGGRAALVEALASAPPPLDAVIALELMDDPPPRALALAFELARGTDLSRAVEALRALGTSRRPEALVPLLEALSPDIDLELQRAAVAGLASLGDRRAIRPLVRHLSLGPEPVADEVALALRKLTDQAFGPDPLAWDTWLVRNAPPEPPLFEPRVHRSEDDLELPTP